MIFSKKKTYLMVLNTIRMGYQQEKTEFSKAGWWFEPLWKIWTSIGMIIPNIWENKKWQPNHQPVILQSDSRSVMLWFSQSNESPFVVTSRCYLALLALQAPPQAAARENASSHRCISGAWWMGRTVEAFHQCVRSILRFPQMGVPQNGWFIMEYPIQMT